MGDESVRTESMAPGGGWEFKRRFLFLVSTPSIQLQPTFNPVVSPIIFTLTPTTAPSISLTLAS